MPSDPFSTLSRQFKQFNCSRWKSTFTQTYLPYFVNEKCYKILSRSLFLFKIIFIIWSYFIDDQVFLRFLPRKAVYFQANLWKNWLGCKRKILCRDLRSHLWRWLDMGVLRHFFVPRTRSVRRSCASFWPHDLYLVKSPHFEGNTNMNGHISVKK